MFNRDFFPTPLPIIEEMLQGIDLTSKNILEPSAGKGDIVDYCIRNGAKSVIACEKHPELRTIVAGKCNVIADDFLTVTSDQVSHIDVMPMNPPFSADEKHIIHAFNIAPAGCQIIALCNIKTITDPYNKFRRQFVELIENYGEWYSLGSCFDSADRETKVEIALVKLRKGGVNYDSEFEGFFMEDEQEQQANGIVSYNFIRDLVNRYVAAIKIYDEQLETAVRLNELTQDYFFANDPKLAISVTRLSAPLKRNEFKKAMQKAGWKLIFEKLNMQKYATKGLLEDINKFVEKQEQVPFTMRNIYRMLEIVIGTQEGRMDRAIIEVFDTVTRHYHENRFGVEGWKTNSHYLINQKFIIDYMCAYSTGKEVAKTYSGTSERNFTTIEDLTKALCYLTGKNYDHMQSLTHRMHYPVLVKNAYTGEYLRGIHGNFLMQYSSMEDAERNEYYYKDKKVELIDQGKALYGEWIEWGFFEVRFYKKGTAHFRFKDPDVWAKFNQRVAKIKGYPLPENVFRKAA